MAEQNYDRSIHKKVFHKSYNKTHTRVKRPAAKPNFANSVIYVNSKSNTKALIEKCEKLLQGDDKKVTIHCLGAAVQRGILLALQLQEKHPSVQVSANTSTVELIDDLQPATDEEDFEIQRRNNSALEITVVSTLK